MLQLLLVPALIHLCMVCFGTHRKSCWPCNNRGQDMANNPVFTPRYAFCLWCRSTMWCSISEAQDITKFNFMLPVPPFVTQNLKFSDVWGCCVEQHIVSRTAELQHESPCTTINILVVSMHHSNLLAATYTVRLTFFLQLRRRNGPLECLRRVNIGSCL